MLKSIIKGFSLLELVVVLAVMGTLAAVAVPAFSAVTDNSSSGALLSSADGLVKSGNGVAQSDSAEPGRGLAIADIDLSGSNDAVEVAGVITVFGQKDQCIQISVSGANSAAVYVTSDVLVSSNVVTDATSGAVTSGDCA
jgi:prepilin-type N-terminal cleavage/methylation domain-containing protein